MNKFPLWYISFRRQNPIHNQNKRMSQKGYFVYVWPPQVYYNSQCCLIKSPKKSSWFCLVEPIFICISHFEISSSNAKYVAWTRSVRYMYENINFTSTSGFIFNINEVSKFVIKNLFSRIQIVPDVLHSGMCSLRSYKTSRRFSLTYLGWSAMLRRGPKVQQTIPLGETKVISKNRHTAQKMPHQSTTIWPSILFCLQERSHVSAVIKLSYRNLEFFVTKKLYTQHRSHQPPKCQ